MLSFQTQTRIKEAIAIGWRIKERQQEASPEQEGIQLDFSR